MIHLSQNLERFFDDSKTEWCFGWFVVLGSDGFEESFVG
jgi:hypothetical protein